MNHLLTCRFCYCFSAAGESKASGQFPKLDDLLNTYKVLGIIRNAYVLFYVCWMSSFVFVTCIFPTYI